MPTQFTIRRLLFAASCCAVYFPALPQHARAGVIDFSPDGRQIAYEWSRELDISSLDGGAPVSVRAADKVGFVQWSPRGRILAFLNRTEAGNELGLYNAATSTARGIGGGFRQPFAWREDGNRFACVRGETVAENELVWYNLVENGIAFRAKLAVSPASPMVWLPTTDDLAFVGADHNVYTVESGELKKVTTTGDVLGLALYAGGKKLVWARRSANLHYILLTVYAYDLTSRNVARLPFPDRVAALNPDPRTAPESIDHVDFSPDGSHMLLYAIRSGANGRSAVLYTVSMDGKSARQIQKLPLASVPGGMADAWTVVDVSPRKDGIEAAWSRDGRMIGVRATVSGAQKLFVTAADGTSPRLIRGDTRP
jgi:Tol biopolymer transport system component